MELKEVLSSQQKRFLRMAAETASKAEQKMIDDAVDEVLQKARNKIDDKVMGIAIVATGKEWKRADWLNKMRLLEEATFQGRTKGE